MATNGDAVGTYIDREGAPGTLRTIVTAYYKTGGYVIRAALLLALLAPAPRVASVSVIYIEPPSETLTTEEQAQATQALLGAFDYWQQLAPDPMLLEITETRTITTAENLYSTYAWTWPLSEGETDITIVVVDNSQSRQLFLSTAAGLADPLLGLVVVSTHGYSGGLAAITAHELGHVVYGLADLDAPCSRDIMCKPSEAYARRTLGCISLAALGRPCSQVWLPVVQT